MLSVAQFVGLSLKAGHGLDAPRLFKEQVNAEIALSHAGFDRKWVDISDEYMMAAVALSGLTWDITAGEMYPEIDEMGRFKVRLTYKGAAKVALDAGDIEHYQTWAIHEGDQVTNASNERYPDVQLKGTDPERAPLLGAIASAKLKSGEYVHYHIEKAELDIIAQEGSEVWRSVFSDEMAKKQALWLLFGHVGNNAINNLLDQLEREFGDKMPKASEISLPRKSNYTAVGPQANATSPLDGLL